MTGLDSSRFERRRVRGDDGAILVEMAFVLPLVLTLIMGLLDFSLFYIRKDTVESAARDGARTGILGVGGTGMTTTAGMTSSTCSTANTNFNRICNAAKARLAGTPIQSVSVQCYSGSSTSTTIACSAAQADKDTVQVTVTWGYSPPTIVGKTYIGTQSNNSATARMVIQ